MVVEITYTALRRNLSSYLDRVTEDCEVLLVKRPDEPDVAIITTDELAHIMESAQLRPSPEKAKRRRSTSRN